VTTILSPGTHSALTGAAPWALKAGRFHPRWCAVVRTAWHAVYTQKRVGGGMYAGLQGPFKNNLPFWMPMHPVRLPVQNIGISRYSCDFAPCRPGASTPKIANLFFR
jgi:hypothetical protein